MKEYDRYLLLNKLEKLFIVSEFIKSIIEVNAYPSRGFPG